MDSENVIVQAIMSQDISQLDLERAQSEYYKKVHQFSETIESRKSKRKKALAQDSKAKFLQSLTSLAPFFKFRVSKCILIVN